MKSVSHQCFVSGDVTLYSRNSLVDLDALIPGSLGFPSTLPANDSVSVNGL